MAKTEFELFEEWAVAKYHYRAIEAIARFKILQKSRKGQEVERPILSADALALLDKRHDEE